MGPKTPGTRSGVKMPAAGTTAEVDAFLLALEHPGKPEIEAIRRAILGASATIAEGIKWNAPSFRTTEYFATVNLREKKGVGVILHLGAKVREAPAMTVEDPAGLLRWLGKDRAMVVFENLKDFASKEAAFEALIQRWIAHVLAPGRL